MHPRNYVPSTFHLGGSPLSAKKIHDVECARALPNVVRVRSGCESAEKHTKSVFLFESAYFSDDCSIFQQMIFCFQLIFRCFKKSIFFNDFLMIQKLLIFQMVFRCFENC